MSSKPVSKPVSKKDAVAFASSAQLGGATDIVVANLNDSAMALAACQGATAFELGATETTIVVYVVDASGSMTEVASAVRDSVKEAAEAYKETKQAAAMTLTFLAFNESDWVAFANKPVEAITDADIQYSAGGMTALYDAVLDAISGAMVYEEQLMRSGMTTKVIVVVFSDGADNSSIRGTPKNIKTIADKLLRSEEKGNWTLAFVGFHTYEERLHGTDYRAIAKGMGFPNILEIDLTGDAYARRHTLRQVGQLVSKSVIRKSQTVIDPNAPADFFTTT